MTNHTARTLNDLNCDVFVESRFDSLLQKIVTLLALTFKFKFDYYLNHVKVPRVPLRYQKLSRSGSKLFDPHWDNEKSGMNPPQTHLAQVTGLLGNFASEFLDRGTKSKRYFDDQGFLLRGAGQYSIKLEDLLSRAGHSPGECCEVADFLSLMLIINPKERWSAAQLLDHPWLKDVV